MRVRLRGGDVGRVGESWGPCLVGCPGRVGVSRMELMGSTTSGGRGVTADAGALHAQGEGDGGCRIHVPETFANDAMLAD